MRWTSALLSFFALLTISGCATEMGLQNQISLSGEEGRARWEIRAQQTEAIETMGIDRLHALGLSGRGVRIFLMAPFEKFLPGAQVPVGFYLQQILASAVPAASVISCNTAGDFFNVNPVQLTDCLLEAITEKPDVVIVGAMSWDTLAPGCDDLLDGKLMRSNLMIFAGAGDSAQEGLSYPACVQGVQPVLATYDEDRSGDLPLLRTCWRSSIHKDELACFTNYLREQALLAAPGALITLKFFGLDIPYCCSTAISATLAGATVALLMEAFPNANPSEVLQALKKTGVPVSDAQSEIKGMRISAYRSYLWLKEQISNSEPQPQPAPKRKTVRDFDLNRDCTIATDELEKAQEAWLRGEIERELFLKVMDAWLNQSDICAGE